MTRIYSPEITAKILTAIDAILLGNNGYADIGIRADVATAVRAAGFIVIETTDLFGRKVFRGFTKAAQAALAAEDFGVRI